MGVRDQDWSLSAQWVTCCGVRGADAVNLPCHSSLDVAVLLSKVGEGPCEHISHEADEPSIFSCQSRLDEKSN